MHIVTRVKFRHFAFFLSPIAQAATLQTLRHGEASPRGTKPHEPHSSGATATYSGLPVPRGPFRAEPRWVCGVVALLLGACTGCLPPGTSEPHVELVWGTRGTGHGQLQKPRAIAMDAEDRLYVVDMTGRIQVFDRDGEFLRAWQTPESTNGKPSGLSLDRAGNLLVADTHYFRVLVYRTDGLIQEKKTLGGTCGLGPGEFHFVTDAVQDSQGNFYVAEYGEFDRIQKFDSHGNFLFQWGGPGSEIGRFTRPQNLQIDEEDHVWVVDSCNHRIQVFDAREDPVQVVRHWGVHGSEPGQLSYPYDLVLDEQGHVYVCEFGNHRIQKFTREGKSLAICGGPGRAEGQFAQPWGLVRDSQGALHVLDTYNHRVQRLRL
jgi:sugar lactone lactonase YvrE